MSEHHGHALTPASSAKHTQTGIERRVTTFFFLSAVISVTSTHNSLVFWLRARKPFLSFLQLIFSSKQRTCEIICWEKLKFACGCSKIWKTFKDNVKQETREDCLFSVGLVWAENQTGTKGTAEKMICSIISVCSRRNRSIHCQHHTTVICPLVYIMLTYGPQLKLTNQTCTWPLTPTSNPLNILNYDDLWRHTTWPHKQNHYNNNSIMTHCW